jgi:GH15 family glucan-1,4-alpha-glucosidase
MTVLRARRGGIDASLLLLAELGLGCRHGSAVHQTHNAIGRELCRNGRIMRYTNDDGFGAPETAFLVYNFWYVDALAVIGRRDEARVLFIDLLDHRNPFGLLSEDIHPETAALWGNIPQTYSMAGTVNSAMRLSVRWEDVWCLVSS